ncbi:MAG TPA: Trm112 family protein [Jatrophihabitans sp.]|nr:Trm112 family protein [Jatrophihabitans sp.]
MPIPSDLLAILACPSVDHAPLELAGEELVCTSCGSRFRISDGIPVLLPDEAIPGPNGLGVPAGETSSAAGAAAGPAPAGPLEDTAAEPE